VKVFFVRFKRCQDKDPLHIVLEVEPDQCTAGVSS
jgi:hypothetical protein